MEEIRSYRIEDEGYPKRLKNIPGAPKALYVLGRLPEEERLSVAVVGARDCSEYGRFVAKELGAALGKNGITVISGMARGIDGISQEEALDAGGSSFGVLGCGVDICYPKENRRLYEKLRKSGGLLSEYLPGTPACANHFPPRNRIVSGLADVVVVVEARVKSGTLITVDMALEQGREVYAVPGRTTDKLSEGCNRLIRQGAGVLFSVEEFIRELLEGEIGRTARAQLEQERRERRKALRKKGERADQESGRNGSRRSMADLKIPEGLPPELAVVLAALDFHPQNMEQIRERLPEEYQDRQLGAYLMRLCMEKLAAQVSPGSFVRAGQKFCGDV